MKPVITLAACALVQTAIWAAAPAGQIRVRLTWGHEAASAGPYSIRLVPASRGVEVRDAMGVGLEAGERLADGALQTRAGAGDVDGVAFNLSYPEEPENRLQNLHIIWADLIAESDADTARRLGFDPAFRLNPRNLTVLMNEEGSRGFTISVDQLLREKALWIPSLHVYAAAGEPPLEWAEHQRQLAAWKGRRILDEVEHAPEANYEQYTARWEDMGAASYRNPAQQGPGHIVCLTWDSAIAKFGIDRGAGVWNDYGNPDRFRFWFDFGDLAKGIERTWKSQRLSDGLPVIATVFEKDGARYEVEQFAYPLDGPPAERRGDIAMVLLSRVTLSELEGKARTVPVAMNHRRQFAPYINSTFVAEQARGSVLFRDAGRRRVLLAIDGAGDVSWSGASDYQREMKRLNATAFLNLPARGSRSFVVKLPSAPVEPGQAETLQSLDYGAARAAAVKFWSQRVAGGAQFRVPEKAVNDLFTATLCHALRLPRRHGGAGGAVEIDLPYSNFAYSQKGTPWPINQAVYVDYMLYDLRGYHTISAEELLAQFRNNQEQDGHVNGFANWLVYTPGMLYAVAKNFLLSHDRQALDRLMPYSLKALDWCMREARRAADREGPTRGLVSGPLNDGTGQGLWCFNQAYMYAGLELFSRVLEEIRDPRAPEVAKTANAIRASIARAFGTAAARSPLVQLRDHTWTPYVPCEAQTYGRILPQWYPTDVDTGAVHLLRLNALDPAGELAAALLNDHEDNLFLHGWGLANEPVYNQQGTAYLLRDDPKAAIRTFYSYMAGAFSHGAFEPVEHRWTHGQYFGPPSTDGAWFELYRNMLIREMADGALLIGQAAPRKWLEDGKRIEVSRAPTYYGDIDFTIESRAASGAIEAKVRLAERLRPRALVVRLRHPNGKPLRAVTVNGQPWSGFDARKEWLRIDHPQGREYSIVASY